MTTYLRPAAHPAGLFLASGLDQAHDDRARLSGEQFDHVEPRARVPPWPGAFLFRQPAARQLLIAVGTRVSYLGHEGCRRAGQGPCVRVRA
jgi:hypothetical protein